jgi:hypothetical protein
MQRALWVLLALLTVSEALILHWSLLASRSAGLSALGGLLAVVAFGVANVFGFPQARKRIRARGLARILSRGWIMGSVAALLAGVMLSTVFVFVGGTGALFGVSGHAHLVWSGGIVLLLGFGTFAWGASVGNLRVRVDDVALPLRDVAPQQQEIRVAHITDLHIGPLLEAERLAGFVNRVNALGADLIVITGDIFDFDPAYIEEGCRELGKLEARLGVFAVPGNHDVHTGVEEVSDAIRQLTEIELLRDAWTEIDVDGSRFVIAGLDDYGEGWTERESEHAALDQIAAEIPEGVPCLLLAHRPSYFRHATRLGFSVMLVGHTHGGQIAVPFAHRYNPSRLISHMTRGVFRDGETTMYVNRGLGMAGLPLRINCPREIALIRFEAH